MSDEKTGPDETVKIHCLSQDGLSDWLENASPRIASWVRSNGFEAKPGSYLLMPEDTGTVAGVLAGVSEPASIWDLAGLPTTLPEGSYALAETPAIEIPEAAETLFTGWILGSYGFDKYKARPRGPARLTPPAGIDERRAVALSEAVYLVRDLVNTPANDMGPSALALAARTMAEQFGAEFSETIGDELLTNRYPAIHAVGRAAADQPRLIEITWGNPDHPTVALVGKGVCFDSGGLDIKSAGGMKLMKKDMGGAAHVLGIARALMALGAKIHLKVLVPAVENAISGNAMRPQDVLPTRAGLTIEIGNTDAEGRVILSDALTRAAESDPVCIIDFATLTGAARVALGTEVPALFCNDDAFAAEILGASESAADPLWRLPLWPGYRKMIEGKVADITNAPEGGYAGAITAALFLEKFVPAGVPWAHVDVMAWNVSSKPGRPEGGEAMGLRAFVGTLIDKFGTA